MFEFPRLPAELNCMIHEYLEAELIREQKERYKMVLEQLLRATTNIFQWHEYIGKISPFISRLGMPKWCYIAHGLAGTWSIGSRDYKDSFNINEHQKAHRRRFRDCVGEIQMQWKKVGNWWISTF